MNMDSEYPLLIKQILTKSSVKSFSQEIVSNPNVRLSYQEFTGRLGRLANSLTAQGISEKKRVGVMDWDTTGYLECFFAIPMIGAILHTINIRLSEQQILYTINHAEEGRESGGKRRQKAY